MKTYTAALGIRGDHLYCPLPFYVDSYWTCEPNCAYCFARRLNRTWGSDNRVADVEAIKHKLLFGGKGNGPLSQAIRQRKTIKLGNRSDPFQNCELKYRVSTRLLEFLREQKWDAVVQTRFPNRALESGALGPNCTLLAEITVGMDQDWDSLERRATEPPAMRISALTRAMRSGIRVGVNGEPFIPGYHTESQFEDLIKLLKSHGVNRFNIYNLHLNDWVAKSLAALGLDIERIWVMNQDAQWRKILRRLIDIADKHDVILGCPDFVNSGWDHRQRCNTCCGIDVANPCTFNTHHFKLAIQEGRDPLECWDGVGDYEEGLAVVKGTADKVYTMKDVRHE